MKFLQVNLQKKLRPLLTPSLIFFLKKKSFNKSGSKGRLTYNYEKIIISNITF